MQLLWCHVLPLDLHCPLLCFAGIKSVDLVVACDGFLCITEIVHIFVMVSGYLDCRDTVQTALDSWDYVMSWTLLTKKCNSHNNKRVGITYLLKQIYKSPTIEHFLVKLHTWFIVTYDISHSVFPVINA